MALTLTLRSVRTRASVQIIGPFYEDDTVITFAELLADVTGGHQRPPV